MADEERMLASLLPELQILILRRLDVFTLAAVARVSHDFCAAIRNHITRAQAQPLAAGTLDSAHCRHECRAAAAHLGSIGESERVAG